MIQLVMVWFIIKAKSWSRENSWETIVMVQEKGGYDLDYRGSTEVGDEGLVSYG